MADQNKLTVAELLARNNKARGEKESKKDNRSRRHRRSLDEGGISVAELTGNLKKVKASPAEAKHTSVSIDEDAPVIRSPKSAEQAGADSAKKPAADPAAKPAAKRAAQPAAKAAQTTKPAAKPTKGIRKLRLRRMISDHRPHRTAGMTSHQIAGVPKR